MTLLLQASGDVTVNASLPQGALVRTRVTPGGQVPGFPLHRLCRTGKEEWGQGGHGLELARDLCGLGGVLVPTAGLVEVHHGGQRMTLSATALS